MAEESVYARCTPADVGIMFQEDAPDELHKLITDYFHIFIAPRVNPRNDLLMCLCEKELSGILGTFNWAMGYGEGVCMSCGRHARAAHSIRDAEGDQVIFLAFILLYHPDYIEAQKEAHAKTQKEHSDL